MTILRPEHPVTNGIARVTISGDTVLARYPEKHETFRRVACLLDKLAKAGATVKRYQ